MQSGPLPSSADRLAPPSPIAMVVDDDEDVRQLIRVSLVRAGFTVVEAGSRDEALRRFSDQAHVDILLSDVCMPDGSGLELHRLLSHAHPGLPVLFMSGYCDDVVEGWGGDGEAGFLEKPFAMHALVRQVRELLVRADRPEHSAEEGRGIARRGTAMGDV